MRNKKRIKTILRALETLWNKHPDQRLGQLLLNYVLKEPIFYQEDDLTLRRLK